MNKETITVKLVHDGKWGKSLLVGDRWYNFDKKSGLTGNEFEKDKTYTVLINTSKTGKKYISQIIATEQLAEVGSGVVAPVLVNKATEEKPNAIDVERAKRVIQAINKSEEKFSETYKTLAKKDVDWDAVNRGKVACVQFEAALRSPGLAMWATNKDEYLKLVTEAAELGIKLTWEHQRG